MNKIAKQRDFLLSEGKKINLNEMATFYKLKSNTPETKKAVADVKAKFKPGTTLYNTLDTLETKGEIDYRELVQQTGKDLATFNNPRSREVLEDELGEYITPGYSDKVQKRGRKALPKDELNEDNLNEMASFYSLKPGKEEEAKQALSVAKQKYKPGTTFYNTLDTLEREGQIDYKQLAKDQGKDIATFNNPKTRQVLEKDLADFIVAGSNKTKSSNSVAKNDITADLGSSTQSLDQLLDLDDEVGLNYDELPAENEDETDIEDNWNSLDDEDDIIDDKGPSKKDIDTSFENDVVTDSNANSFKNIISKKVSKIEKATEDGDDEKYKVEITALKQYLKNPKVKQTLGTELIRNLVSSVIN